MNPLWLHPLGWALVHAVWQIGSVALCYRAFLPLFRDRPRVRYWVSLSAVALSFVTVGATWMRQAPPAPPVSDARAVARIETGHAAPAAFESSPPQSASRVERFVATVESHLSAAALLWLAGVGVAGIGFVRAYEHCRRLGESVSDDASPEVLEHLDRSAERLKLRRAVRIGFSADVDSPVLVGWRRPKIVLPQSLSGALTEVELQAVIDHELAHVARADYPVNLAQTVIERLLFFHPALRWLSREVRVAREYCCDDLAATASRGGALAYARALLRLEEIRIPPAVALGVTGGDLFARVQRLLDSDRSVEAGGIGRVTLRLVAPFSALCVAALLTIAGVSASRVSAAATTVLDGLDPVHLLAGREVAGSTSFTAHVDGYRYLFADHESLTKFRDAPGRYAVRNTELCPVTGKAVRPDVWRVVDGRVVLFCCPGVSGPQLTQARIAFAHRERGHAEH